MKMAARMAEAPKEDAESRGPRSAVLQIACKSPDSTRNFYELRQNHDLLAVANCFCDCNGLRRERDIIHRRPSAGPLDNYMPDPSLSCQTQSARIELP